MRLRAETRLLVERTGWHNDLPSAARVMRKRRAASPTERGGEAACRRKIEANDLIAPGRPRELERKHVEIGGTIGCREGEALADCSALMGGFTTTRGAGPRRGPRAR